MLKNKKGFTLVELLAVIVILAIILAIAVPTISTLISNQKKASFVAGVKMLIKGVDYDVLTRSATTVSQLNGGSAYTAATYGGSTADYTTFTVNSLNPVNVTVVGGGQFANCTLTSVTFTTAATSGITGTC